MKLRNFLYLNTKIINDYLSSIEGCLYDEEDQSIATSSEKAIKAGIGIKAISGDGSRLGKTEEEVKDLFISVTRQNLIRCLIIYKWEMKMSKLNIMNVYQSKFLMICAVMIS